MSTLILLNNLPSINKKPKRVGRGDRSHGNKSGRGSDGQKSRSGSRKVNKEGGQSPTYLRQRKRGFLSRSSTVYKLIKTSDLYHIINSQNTDFVDRATLVRFLGCKSTHKIKVLFDVEIDRKIKVEADRASQNALNYVVLN